jgi:hypothetical protein
MKCLTLFKAENPTANIVIDLSYSFTNPNAMVEQLKQVKYVINLPYYDNNSLETHRINRALSAGCEVVSLFSKDKYLNRQYGPYVHFVKELSDFTFLLEQEKKGDYQALMQDFGFHAIESNLRGIHHAERKWTASFKELSASKESVVPKDPIETILV